MQNFAKNDTTWCCYWPKILKLGAFFGQIFQSRLSLKSKKWHTHVKNFQSTPPPPAATKHLRFLRVKRSFTNLWKSYLIQFVPYTDHIRNCLCNKFYIHAICYFSRILSEFSELAGNLLNITFVDNFLKKRMTSKLNLILI